MSNSRTTYTVHAINSRDRLIIRSGPAGLAIEAQDRSDDHEAANAGPFSPGELREALDELAPVLEQAGSYTRNDECEELAAAKAEAAMCQTSLAGQIRRAGQAEEHLRARTVDLVDAIEDRDKARRERDEALRHECPDLDAHWRLDEAHVTIKEQAALIETLHAEQPRALGPDDITDEMVLRGMQVYYTRRDSLDDYNAGLVDQMHRMLTATLTPPPARDPLAEQIEDELIDAIGCGVLTDEEFTRVADRLAALGYLKEQS